MQQKQRACVWTTILCLHLTIFFPSRFMFSFPSFSGPLSLSLSAAAATNSLLLRLLLLFRCHYGITYRSLYALCLALPVVFVFTSSTFIMLAKKRTNHRNPRAAAPAIKIGTARACLPFKSLYLAARAFLWCPPRPPPSVLSNLPPQSSTSQNALPYAQRDTRKHNSST